MRVGRRTWLKAGFAAACPSAAWTQGARPRLIRYPFQLGVASGDPVADGIVLWTRVTLDDPAAVRALTVEWEIGREETLRTVVKRGEVIARAERAHCVHVDVRGLEPQTPYWYRFRVRGEGGAVESPVGRTRTAPAPGAPVSSWRFGQASCQKYEDGYYTAWRHLTKDELDVILFLGDYIYEGAAKTGMPRPHPPAKAMTLEDYRERYALYKSDPDLQEAHRLFPWLIVWDDHELFNDYAAESIDRDPQVRARRAAAYQAFFEHMPLRGGIRQPLYRQLDWGTLARLVMLDTRRYRSAAVCGGGLQRPCEELHAPGRTMLGRAQEQWLAKALTSSGARWQVIGQQIPFAMVDREAGPAVSWHMDKWDGYPGSRDRLLALLERRGKKDTVILTGDNHNAWVMSVARQPERPLAVEFVCTSISSTGDGSAVRKEYASALRENPHAHYLNSRRGYTRGYVTAEEWRTEFLTVPWVSRPGADLSLDAAFVMRHGDTRVERT